MFSNQLIYYSDAFVIGYFLNAGSVTYYTIAWSLTEYIKRFALAFGRTFMPVFSEIYATGATEELHNLYLSGTKYMLIFSNLLCIGFIVLGGPFIGLWMGEKYQVLCTPILIILFLTLLTQAPQLISYALLQGQSKHKMFSTVSIFVSILNLILSIILVNKYGLIGVAIGAAIPQICFNIFYAPFHTCNSLNLSVTRYFKRTFLKLAIPSLTLASSLYIIGLLVAPSSYLLLFFNSIISTILYFLCIYYISFDNDEKIKVRKYITNKFLHIVSSTK